MVYVTCLTPESPFLTLYNNIVHDRVSYKSQNNLHAFACTSLLIVLPASPHLLARYDLRAVSYSLHTVYPILHDFATYAD